VRTTPIIMGVAALFASAAMSTLAFAQQGYPQDNGQQQQQDPNGPPQDQQAGPPPDGAQQQYQNDQQQYQDQQNAYQAAQQDYQNQSADYAANHQAYEAERNEFLRQRAAYDARYGEGAYYRYFSLHRAEYDARHGPGAFDRDFVEYRADAGPVSPEYRGPVIDDEGRVYAYDQTYPYRDGAWGSEHGYSYYSHRQCRLAMVRHSDGRKDLVPVCPDGHGGYRIER
jgi:hypothetical protein